MNLFLSTASQNLIITIFDDNKNIIKNIKHLGKNNHSEIMMPMLKEALEGVEINKIYVVNGPGSYTGLRVAMTFAKTYAYINNIDLFVVSYLDAIYHTYDTKVAIDAKGKKYFTYDGNSINLTNEIDGYLVDEELDTEVLINKDYFSTMNKIDPKEASINYVKSAI